MTTTRVRFYPIITFVASHVELLFDIGLGLLGLASPSGRTPESCIPLALDILKLLCEIAQEALPDYQPPANPSPRRGRTA
ncbi:hypothetical protein OYT00_12900 [Microbacterium paraoxydans]|uniref:hypothetical protein n=1 Tax=Microbacterium paraoxydans TaxID=199592 RepID=UPI00228626DD|nr:hypothetical protein [Microbacterium paraoxydans]MCZ0710902.1 hypothetical protein [Microbacterium paraoxydans]